MKKLAVVILLLVFCFVFSGCAGKKMSADDYANKAIGYGIAGKFKKAKSNLVKALKIDPFNSGAIEDMGMLKDALDKKIKKETAVCMFKASDLANKGDMDGVAAEYKKAIELDPGYARAHNNLALIYLQQRKLEEAMGGFKQAIKLDPNYVNAHSNLGGAYYWMERNDEAISEYKKAIELNPNLPIIHYNLALAYTSKNEIGKAVSEYQKAVEINPDYADAHYELGLIYYASGRPVKLAIEEAEKSLKINPDHARSHRLLARIYLGEGLFGKAKDEALKTLEVSDESPEADYIARKSYYRLGLSEGAQGNFEQAKKEFEESSKIRGDWDKESIEISEEICDDAISGKIKKEAAVSLFKALESDDKINTEEIISKLRLIIELNREAYFMEKVFNKQDNSKNPLKEEAISECEKAIKTEPNYAPAYYIMGKIYASEEKLKGKAIPELQKAVRLDPDNYMFHLALAVAYNDNELYDKSIDEYKKTIKLNPKSGIAYYELGLIYWDGKRDESAGFKYLNKSVELGIILPPGMKKDLESYKNRNGY